MQRGLGLAILISGLVGCGSSGRMGTGTVGGTNGKGTTGTTGNGTSTGSTSSGTSGSTTGTTGNSGCDPFNPPGDGDQDLDGYTPNQGDCDDCNPLINPGAIQIAGDTTDYACNGMPGVVPTCDAMTTANDATSMAQAFEQCDSRFFQGAMLVGPSDTRARAVTNHFGTAITPKSGKSMALISTGLALDKAASGFVDPQTGTNLGCKNEYMNPLPDVPANPACANAGGGLGGLGGPTCQPATVNDYTELVVKLKAPMNAQSFSFQFQFFSAEYPEFVCSQFNDEFLVLMDANKEFATTTNISFDMNKNPITVNNGLFTVCQNYSQGVNTTNCTQALTTIAGTGYDDADSAQSPEIPNTAWCSDDDSSACADGSTGAGGFGGGGFGGGGGGGGGSMNEAPPPLGIPIGGSTGWLTTTVPVTPGEEITLHFIIFDEGDHIYDSAVLIDNFQWLATPTTAPTTIG